MIFRDRKKHGTRVAIVVEHELLGKWLLLTLVVEVLENLNFLRLLAVHTLLHQVKSLLLVFPTKPVAEACLKDGRLGDTRGAIWRQDHIL